MKVLYITNMYPNKYHPYSGTFIKQEIEWLEKNGIEVKVIFINSMKSKFEYIKSPFNLMNVLLKEKFQVINVHHTLLLPQTLLVKKLLGLKTPVIFTLHEGEISNQYVFNDIFSRIVTDRRWKIPFIKQVNMVIAKNSETIGDINNLPPLVEITTPVDIEIFKPMDKTQCRKNLGIEVDNIIIFFPADPKRPEKNFRFLEKVLEELNKNTVKPIKIITGPVLPDKMILYYNACDVVCLPSLYEASPAVIKEAMAGNKPIVASDVGDIRRTVSSVIGCFVMEDFVK